MAGTAGKKGKVMIGANAVTALNNWSLELGLDTLETTAFGDEWKNFIAGLKEWSASSEGAYNVHADTNGQAALQNAFLNGTEVDLKLYVNTTNYYSGQAIISSLSVEDPVDDIVTISIEFQGNGALSYT
jgi:TP901-1 family phage major tail protein